MNPLNPIRHPWEIARADFLIEKIKLTNAQRLIDIGSGDGYLGSRIENELGLEVVYVDSSYCSEKLSLKNHFKSVNEITAQSSDVILMGDVLEHIEQPIEFLIQLAQNFSGTRFVLTVPAFQFVFSTHDEFLGHYRRYNKKSLGSELELVASELKLRYFFFLPFLIRLLQVLFKIGIKTNSVSKWKYDKDHWISRLVLRLFWMDLNISCLPGLSVLAEGKLK